MTWRATRVTLWSLRAKLMALIVLSLLPVVALEFNTAAEARARAAAEVEKDAIRLTRLVASSQQAILESARQLLMTLAQVDGVRRSDVAACQPLLRNLLKLNPIYANMGACDSSGEIYCAGARFPGLANIAQQPYFRRALETRNFALGHDPGGLSGVPTLVLAYPVLNYQKELAGAVFVAIDLRAASAIGERVPLPEGGTMMVLNEDDIYLLRYPEPRQWVGKKAGKANLIRAIPPDRSEGILRLTEKEGRERIYAVERLDAPGDQHLYVSVGIDRDPAYAPFYGQLVRQLGVVTGIAAAALFGAWLIGSRSIVKPARHLVGVARAVTAGNLRVRSSLPPETGEFGEIGSAFNQMADALGRRIAELNEVQQALRQAHDQLESRVERRTAELRRARERLVDAIENIDAGFAMFGPDERLVICNRTFPLLFGVPAEAAMPGVRYEEILRAFVAAGGKVAGFDDMEPWIAAQLATFKLADGRNVEEDFGGNWIRISAHRTRDGGVVSLLTDVTNLKEIQESLVLRNRAIASLNSGVIVTDPTLPDNPIVDVNPAFEQITGYGKEEVMGRNCRLLQGPESSPEAVAAMRQAIAQERGSHVLIRNYRKDGSPFWNESKIDPVRDGDGRLTHFVGVMTDVTERAEAQEALERAAQELRRSNEELERFAYVASHDLQEPLRMVASYTQLLARRYGDKLDQNAKDFIDFAVDGAQRMQAFIQDLLKYSRVGTHGRPFEKVEIAAVLRSVRENLRFAIEEKNAEIVTGPMPVIEGDRVQLQQLFQNLIGNALKFNGEKPLRIEIEAVFREGEWEFAVRDNGIGIDKEDAERIFVIFQRLHSRQEYAGTGIGLAICKKIVERHGGRIWVESRKGEGATFHFTVPQKDLK